MKYMVNRFINVILLLAALVMAGCGAVHVRHAHDHDYDHGYGPPPHAPAHGYRHKYHSHELAYDAHLGVYIVVGLSHHYFHDGHYYRYDQGDWHYSDRLDGKWYKDKHHKIPPGLDKKYPKDKKGH